MNGKKTAGLLLIVLTIVGLSGTAMAANYPYYCGYGLGYGCGLGAFGCGQGYEYSSANVPYFALHPPVYYSHPVAYPYGYSPFPNLPNQPVVDQGQAEPPAAQATHLPPLRIVNPYVH